MVFDAADRRLADCDELSAALLERIQALKGAAKASR